MAMVISQNKDNILFLWIVLWSSLFKSSWIYFG